MESVTAVVEIAQTGAEQVGVVDEGITARLHTEIPSAAVDLLSDEKRRPAARAVAVRRGLPRGKVGGQKRSRHNVTFFEVF